MKRLLATLLTLLLLMGTGSTAMAKPPSRATTILPEKSTYEFNYLLPDYVVEDEDATLGVSLKTKVLGQNGYDDAYIKFSATGPGEVNFSKDISATYADEGTLAAFDLPVQYNVTTDWTINFMEDGLYNITFQLFDTNDNELAVKTQEIEVSDGTGAFVYKVPENIYVDTEVAVNVGFVTQQDYEDVHFSFVKLTGTGDVIFRAQDSNSTWHTFTNMGTWGPAAGFDIDGPTSETTLWKLTFTEVGTYDITFKLVTDSNAVLVEGIQRIVESAQIDEEEEENDQDEDDQDLDDQDQDGKGNTHGLLNALRAHLKNKNKGNSMVRVQSTNRLMELLQERGMSQEELENSIAEMEEAISGDDSDTNNFKALAKMKEQMGKKYETYINGEKVIYDEDAQPLLENNRTLVPFRKLAEILGAEVAWDGEKRQITVTKDDKYVVITIDQVNAIVEGEEVTLDVPAKIYKNRTLVPLRFIAEALDTTVDFYPEGSLISIKKKDIR
jgi:hypothetical protein